MVCAEDSSGRLGALLRRPGQHPLTQPLPPLLDARGWGGCGSVHAYITNVLDCVLSLSPEQC